MNKMDETKANQLADVVYEVKRLLIHFDLMGRGQISLDYAHSFCARIDELHSTLLQIGLPDLTFGLEAALAAMSAELNYTASKLTLHRVNEQLRPHVMIALGEVTAHVVRKTGIATYSPGFSPKQLARLLDRSWKSIRNTLSPFGGHIPAKQITTQCYLIDTRFLPHGWEDMVSEKWKKSSKKLPEMEN